jgi:vacuolar-type H+-ATPase subunit I/STV1
MKHSREDYNGRIVDLAGLIPAHEPVFLLRGKDIATPTALQAYANELHRLGVDRFFIRRVTDYIVEILQWQNAHANDCKKPDMPTGEIKAYQFDGYVDNRIKELSEKLDAANSSNTALREDNNSLRSLVKSRNEKLDETFEKVAELTSELNSIKSGEIFKKMQQQIEDLTARVQHTATPNLVPVQQIDLETGRGYDGDLDEDHSPNQSI